MGKQAVEYSVGDFIQMRFKELGIDRNPNVLFDEAAKLRTKIDSFRNGRFHSGWIGALTGFVGAWFLISEVRMRHPSVWLIVICIVLLIFAYRAARFCFHGEQARRFPTHKGKEWQYEIDSATDLKKVLEPVVSGHAQLARIASSGTSTAFTPVSKKPIEAYLTGPAIDDAWLPSELLHTVPQTASMMRTGESPAPEFMIVLWQDAPEPPQRSRDRWKRYYLWHLEPNYVAKVFDRAKSIYKDEHVKRRKARYAVLLVCEHFAKCREENRPVSSQTVLAGALKKKLGKEADRLLSEGAIDELSARMLRLMGMSGEEKPIDPAEPRSMKKDRSESWFHSLLSGTNDQILPAIRAEAVKDFPSLEEFKGEQTHQLVTKPHTSRT